MNSLPKLNTVRFNEAHKEPQKPLKLWPDQTEEKSRRVKAEGDFTVNSAALSKKYREVLMGRGPEDGLERKEIERDESDFDQEQNLNENQAHVKNSIREKLVNKAKTVAKVAMKMDGSAELDEDGYKTAITEDQKFRVQEQTRKRVKIPFPISYQSRQNEGLLARKLALTSQNEKQAVAPDFITTSKHSESDRKRANAPVNPEVTDYAKKARSSDVIHETILKRDDLTVEIGKLFLRIIGTDVDLVSSFSSLTEESKRNGQVLILKEIQKLLVPSHEEQHEEKIVEGGTREEVELLASHLGKVFVDIGLTLPSGLSVEDARRNDAIALSIGSRAIQNSVGVGGLLKSGFTRTDSQKSELLATAMGRILLHLRGASQVMTARMESPEIQQSRDSSILALGRLTLQMIEQSATNKIERFEIRRQNDDLVRKLGLAVFSGVSAQSLKPFLEEAKRNGTTASTTNKFVGSDQTASIAPSAVEESKKHVLVQKQSQNIQASVERSPLTQLQVKQPFAESNEMNIVKNPSIDSLPSKTRTFSSRSKTETKQNVVLSERQSESPVYTLPERPHIQKQMNKVTRELTNENEEEPTLVRKKKRDPLFSFSSASEELEPVSVWKQKKI
jgi:hypothetical protein